MNPKLLERHTRPTKTLNVGELKSHVNYLLSLPTFTQDEKRAFCTLLQDVLFSTRQYNGFNYISWLHEGYDKWVKDGSPADNKPYLGEEFDRYYY